MGSGFTQNEPTSENEALTGQGWPGSCENSPTQPSSGDSMGQEPVKAEVHTSVTL